MIPKNSHQQHTVGVCCRTENLQLAENLAKQLNLPLTAYGDTKFDLLVVVTDHYLGLDIPAAQWKQPFYIDFSQAQLRYRQQHASFKSEHIARAMGCKPEDQAVIVDATAGLGRDSFILASLGYSVILIEQSQLIFLLLENAYQRSLQQVDLQTIFARWKLYNCSAETFLSTYTHPIDIVYLDPMFPERTKSAAVKKDMQILQQLALATSDAEALFNLAISCARKRVVVKRPRLSNFITATKPNFSLTGKSTRFDIYLV